MRVLLLLIFIHKFCFSQIILDNNSPYDSPQWLIDNILLGSGVTASNHQYFGDSAQIGWFDATNTSLGIDEGIILATGEYKLLDPNYVPQFLILPNVTTDPDLLNVANSVPSLIGQTFTVSSINDVAKLEFDFVPKSDTIKFRYVFGSQEYFGWENTQYNDVFGFFLSGPGIIGPYSSPAFHPNGSINLAIVPNSNPPLPITVSSVNSVGPMNPQYFIDNSTSLDTISDVNGYTTVFTATAVVQCGETYHIRLSIADGSDGSLNSYVWLEAGSFNSPSLNVQNNLGIDSNQIEIACNTEITLTADAGIGSTYQWYDSTGNIVSNTSSITVGAGMYWVSAISAGCNVDSDTIFITSSSPSFDLGPALEISCNENILVTANPVGGSGNYNYQWSNGATTQATLLEQGSYNLIVTDDNGCSYIDSLLITNPNPGIATISGGCIKCFDGELCEIIFNFSGAKPWNLKYLIDNDTIYNSNILQSDFILPTIQNGGYSILEVIDSNNCAAIPTENVVQVSVFENPDVQLSDYFQSIYENELTSISTVSDYVSYSWFDSQGNFISENKLLQISVSGVYYVVVIDSNGCISQSDSVTISTKVRPTIFIPNTFTPNNDEHNDFLQIFTDNVVSFDLEIYNRWGESVFNSKNENDLWDGTYENNVVPQGSYFYKIEFVGIDFEKYEKTGQINVLY